MMTLPLEGVQDDQFAGPCETMIRFIQGHRKQHKERRKTLRASALCRVPFYFTLEGT
jgi:hypothetical protein